jgi:hypothetical protein
MGMGHHHMDHQLGPSRLPDGQGFYVLRLVVRDKVEYAGVSLPAYAKPQYGVSQPLYQLSSRRR